VEKQSRSIVFLYGYIYRFLAIVAILSVIWMPPKAIGEVKWRSGPAAIPKLDREELARQITELTGRPEHRHVVIQTNQTIGLAKRKKLRDAGLNVLRYVGNNAFFASFSSKVLNPRALSAIPFLSGIKPIEREWKLHPLVLAGKVPGWAAVRKDSSGAEIVAVYVLFHPDVTLFTEAIDVVMDHEVVIRDTLESINGLIIELPLANINALADEDAIQWIEWPLSRMSVINDSNRAITEADVVQQSSIDGSGVKVLVYDGGTARDTHVDFGGRLTVHDSSGMHYHATHVAGTIGGDGYASSGVYRGMAPGVTMLSYGFEYDGSGIFLYSNPGDIESDYNEAINTYGAHISNNSIGTNTESNGFDCSLQGDYGVTSQLIDTIIRGDGSNGFFTNPFRIVWANGNERQGSRCDVEGYGDYYSTAPPAGAKNHITVGALNSNDDSMTSFSSWGPVDDGRMKPDVSAPGCQSGGDDGVTSTDSSSDTAYTTLCGTSMAAPTVCGLSALLLQDFRALYPGEPDPRNSTLKILLAHNAEDLGNIGPDYQYGYGSVRIQQTLDFMLTGNFLEDQVDEGGIFSVLVRVNPGDPVLKVTLAWDDVPGTPNIDPALVNDLDLRVFAPNSEQYYPWTLDPGNPNSPAVQTQANHIDNIEQVFVDSPTDGVWRIEVYGYSVPQGPQPFSLSASPTLIACSSQGTIVLDSAKYNCNDGETAGIQVIDCDLNTNNTLIETVMVTITSDSEPGGESVLLTETGADTAEFRGSIWLNTNDSANILLIGDGDMVTATYLDANNGHGGINVPVSATATVDCTSPVIDTVQTTDTGPFNATVTFNTDEPANGMVRYGSTCGSLTHTVAESGYKTVHSINLTDLQENTDYFYAVDAIDEAGNTSTDNNGEICYSFTTHDIPDYFTELFSSDNDLDNLSLTFKPNDTYDFYSACAQSITDLPVDPIGGTTLTLSDDSYATVTLSEGNKVSLYGISYDTFYVGSNGYITFTAGDSNYTESIADHFDVPRISPLFDDLNPSSAGTVRWQELTDRVVVTWQDVPQYNGSGSNTFQVQLLFDEEESPLDGTIVISYLSIDATDGLAGLSEGNGEPPVFYESDLSAMEACICDDALDCDDGLFCNGSETCLDQTCQPGTDPCPEQFCDETKGCLPCDNDGTCDTGEDCNTCPNDCIIEGRVEICGNGVCEPYIGEDCLSCPEDCTGKQNGKPSKQFCCGDGDGVNPVDCNDARCTSEGYLCNNVPKFFCCGDSVCGEAEDSINCEIDCGPSPVCGDGTCDSGEDPCCLDDCGMPPPETDCTDGVDNDCDGLIDGDDGDCILNCGSRGDPCSSDSDCCNQCNRGRGTCK
jgi:hypothetical protein